MPRLIHKISPFLFVIMEYLTIFILYEIWIYELTFLVYFPGLKYWDSLFNIAISVVLLILRIIFLRSNHNYKIHILFLLNLYFYFVIYNTKSGYLTQYVAFVIINFTLYYFDYYCLEFLKGFAKKDESN